MARNFSLDNSPVMTNEKDSEEINASRQEWQEELSRIEEEIKTLQLVLQSKQKRRSELRTNLGITITAELKHGIEIIKDSKPFLRTSALVRSARDKTTSNWSLFRNSEYYRNVESKLTSAYSSMKTYAIEPNQSTLSKPIEAGENLLAEEDLIPDQKPQSTSENKSKPKTKKSSSHADDVELF